MQGTGDSVLKKIVFTAFDRFMHFVFPIILKIVNFINRLLCDHKYRRKNKLLTFNRINKYNDKQAKTIMFECPKCGKRKFEITSKFYTS